MRLPPFVVAALRRHRVRQVEERLEAGPFWRPEPDLEDLVFLNKTGQPPGLSAIGAQLEQLCARAGVQRLTPHALRHGCASLLLAQGATLAQIQLVLRHSTPTITGMVYTHLSDEVLGEQADLMQRLLGGDDGDHKGDQKGDQQESFRARGEE
jgi:integrase